MIDTIEQSIRDRVAEILQVAPENIDASKPFSRLGMDSLGLVQLTAAIEDDLDRQLTAYTAEELTIQSLASLLKRPRQTASLARTTRELMLSDSVLPPDIQPQTASIPAAERFLLTGATGFLGAHLLSSLLRSTTLQAICLGRRGREPALQRIEQNLRAFGLWSDRFPGRIQVIDADLAQPRLGLAPASFETLARNVDTIFHCAASVNWIQPYSALRASNVLPLRELLRLACRTKAKPFHFVSTLGVGYSAAGPREIDEGSDAFCDIDGVPLAYAQSKLVAEALVRAAGDRGLPTTIFRPSFISGNSVSGISNVSDFISALIKGCIQMGAAPDLDWGLDAIPVDFTADAVMRLTTGSNAESGCRVFHLANPSGRYWRELVLWMNLYGYRIQLLPYEQWLMRFRTLDAPDFPLRPLAPFFERRLPLRFEEPVKRRIRQDKSLAALRHAGLECPQLSATLIEKYFATFIRQGFLDAPGNVPDRRKALGRSEVFNSIFGSDRVESSCPVEFKAGSSIINELSSWKHRDYVGLQAYRVKLRGRTPFDVVVKAKSSAAETAEIGKMVAGLCSVKLGQAYAEFSDSLGVVNSDARELKIYQSAPKGLRRFMPRFYGGWQSADQTVLVLERLSDVSLMNEAHSVNAWKPDCINAAIDGLAEIHATGYGREPDVVRDIVVGPYPTRESMLKATPLWLSLAEHAKPLFEPWTKDLADWDAWITKLGCSWKIIESMPRTLIHNDFNSRNIALRRTSTGFRLCAYDWELATLGLPQHDLAELLCFVLGTEPRAEDLEKYLQRHRRALSTISDVPIDKHSWREGFALCLEDLMINRLPAYAMIHRFQPQRFLERVVRTWAALYRLVS